MFSFTCKDCNKDFAGDEEVLYCPYCGHDDFIVFNPNQYVRSAVATPSSPFTYFIPKSPYASELSMLTALTLMLEPNRTIKHGKIQLSEKPVVNTLDIVNAFDRLARLYVRKTDTREFVGPLVPDLSKNDVYTELRYISDRRSVCFAQSSIMPTNLENITKMYLDNGWTYNYTKGNTLRNITGSL